MKVPGCEPTTEITRGRRIWDGPGTERVEEGGIVAAQFDVVKHESAAHRVVRDVEDVVRLAIRAPPLQDRQPRVESFHESDFVRELMHCANSATRNRVVALCQLV